MKICPGCREEYLESMTRCAGCDVDLLDEDDAKLLPVSREFLSKEELLASETVIFTEAALQQCRELEKILYKANISCAVFPVNLDQSSATLGSTSSMNYRVVIRVSDVLAAQEAMRGHFYAQVLKEGQGDLMREAVDLSQDSITCPACLETGSLKDGECPHCGLALGVPLDS